jgi:hypothetical protein
LLHVFVRLRLRLGYLRNPQAAEEADIPSRTSSPLTDPTSRDIRCWERRATLALVPHYRMEDGEGGIRLVRQRYQNRTGSDNGTGNAVLGNFGIKRWRTGRLCKNKALQWLIVSNHARAPHWYQMTILQIAKLGRKRFLPLTCATESGASHFGNYVDESMPIRQLARVATTDSTTVVAHPQVDTFLGWVYRWTQLWGHGGRRCTSCVRSELHPLQRY